MATSLRSFVYLSIPSSSFDRPNWQTWFYLVAQLIGGVGLTLLLVTMLWPTKKRKPRNPLLVSMCLAWWLSSFPSVLLLYYAGQVTGPPPQHSICLASAVLTMSQTALAALTAPALIFHIWLVVQTAIGAKFTDGRMIPTSTIVCLIFPWAIYGAFAFAALALGLREPQLVRRAAFYCVIDDTQLTEALGVVGSVAMLTAIILEVWTVVLLHKNRSCVKQLSRDGRGLDFSFVLRVCIFGGYVLLGLCLNILSIINWTSSIPDLFYATFPAAVFVVFGTQPDIWRIWRDASRQVTSRRTTTTTTATATTTGILSHASRASPPPFALPPALAAVFGGTARNARRRSYPARPSHPWSPASTHASPLPSTHTHTHSRSLPPTLPLPAALRRARPPFIPIQSTPDLLHSAPSTPSTPDSPALPEDGAKTPDAAAPWRLPHAYPPLCVPGGGWAYLPSVLDLRASESPVDDDSAGTGFSDAGFGDSRAELLGAPAGVVRGDSGLWDPPAADGAVEYDEDGARVWRAL